MGFGDVFKNNKINSSNQNSKRNFGIISKCRKEVNNFIKKNQSFTDPKINHRGVNQKISVIDHGTKDYKQLSRM